MNQELKKSRLAAVLSAEAKEYGRVMNLDEKDAIRPLTAYKETRAEWGMAQGTISWLSLAALSMPWTVPWLRIDPARDIPASSRENAGMSRIFGR